MLFTHTLHPLAGGMFFFTVVVISSRRSWSVVIALDKTFYFSSTRQGCGKELRRISHRTSSSGFYLDFCTVSPPGRFSLDLHCAGHIGHLG